ncbi:Kinesin-associated protein 3-like [Caenorhabditis elegans]|uniref:Kinesin-associated protein 3-like n=1 Tax=Caenorhabditis elegans TaxID=6239 RepID=Q9XUL3_CAEEL|nr:Kinesin-associated protein 3-like [Caenorhabditis elegans]CAB04913.2 Kinesin-associated protein 3-like [Caenorhabditis elegans]|eukprot:NP_507827.2 Uncharacterized protein CELE_W04E12.4 [Caenorhabditis elegans]
MPKTGQAVPAKYKNETWDDILNELMENSEYWMDMTLPKAEQRRNYEKMAEVMRRIDVCRERQKATLQKLRNLEKLVEQDENGAEISEEEQEMLMMLKLDQNAHQAILNLRNSDLEGLDPEVKDTIMYFRKIEMEDEIIGQWVADDSDNDENVKNSPTSEPESDDGTDSDLESEILETDEMDDVTTSPQITSSVPKFALICIVPIVLAILLYLAPIDFSKLFNGLYEN